MPFILRKTICETFLERVRATPDTVGFQYKPTHSEAGKWKRVTYREFHDECRDISMGLLSLGVEKGDRVVILSNTRYEWSLSDMAILGASAITVPIYASNTAEDVLYILEHSEARAAIVEDAKQLQKLIDQRAANPQCLPKLETVVLVEPAAMTLMSGRKDFLKNVLTLGALKELGRREEVREPGRFDRNLAAAAPDDLFTICYTSGTTGVPKGAMLAHDSMMSMLEDCHAVLGRFVEPEKEVVCSFLPFSHILGKAESMAGYTFGWRQCFAQNIDTLMADLAETKPTVVFAVPRVFEKAFNRVHAAVEAGSKTKRELFHWAFEAGKRYYGAIWERRRPSIKDLTEYQVAKALVFRAISQRFGGSLRFAICGGAPLPREIGEFLQIVGITVLEGYGLTETCAPVALNTPDDPRFGAVGKPLPEVSIKIAEDGEILVKSRKLFRGYYKMPRETEEALEGGWFRTGDIGLIDDDGFLKITDRKKDLIITSGGKNVAPQKIENLARSRKLISQFVVQGDGRNYLTALINLDRDQVIQYAKENQILFSEFSELIRNPKIIALAQKAVDEVNAHLASFETIKKFVILPDEFTIDGGELTPSLKVRRGFVNRKYANEIASMYG